MSLAEDDVLFGRIALHYKLVTPDQLNEAAALQAQEGGARRLGDVLADRGILTAVQLQKLLAVQEDYIAKRDAATLDCLYPPSDPRFIRIRTDHGWAVLLDTPMSAHKQFGDLRVGTIVDCLAPPEEATPGLLPLSAPPRSARRAAARRRGARGAGAPREDCQPPAGQVPLASTGGQR